MCWQSSGTFYSNNVNPFHYSNQEWKTGCVNNKSMWAIIAVTVGGITGVILLVLSGMNILGSVGSVGFIVGMSAGGLLVFTAIISSIIWVAINSCKHTDANITEDGNEQRNPEHTGILEHDNQQIKGNDQSKISAQQHQKKAIAHSQPSPFTELPRDMVEFILKFLNFHNLSAFGLVSRKGYDLMRVVMIRRACDYGYTANQFLGARAYIKKFRQEINLLVKKNNPEKLDAELIAINLQSTDAEGIYEKYNKLINRMALFETLSSYFLKIVNDRDMRLNKVINDGNKLLINAAESGAKNAVKLLLTIGVDPNLPTGNMSPPLHWAAQGGFDEVVTLLLDHKARINDLSPHGNTALCFAVGCGDSIPKPESQIKTVRILLERRANPNIPASNGSTALHLAAQASFDRVVTLLLDHGAKINGLNQKGSTALCSAVGGGSQEFSKSESEVIKTVRILLARGAHPNLSANSLPLHWAAKRGFNQIVTLLLDRGADIHELNNQGRLAIFYAAQSKKKDTVRLLLRYGADPDVLVDFL